MAGCHITSVYAGIAGAHQRDQQPWRDCLRNADRSGDKQRARMQQAPGYFMDREVIQS
jgi:hypothetical protein